MRDKILLIIVGIILLGASGFATYYFLNQDKKPVVTEQFSDEEKADIYQMMISGNLTDYSQYLDDGKKLSFAFKNNKTPLEVLIEQNDILSAAKLMENGFDLTLVNNNHIDTVFSVIAHNELVQIGEFDVITAKLIYQIKDEIEKPNRFGYSILIKAIETNNQFIVEEALKYITDINKIYNEESALNFACKNGETDLEIVKILVNKGADINLKTDGGNTCLMKAVLFEQPDLIHYLITETNININSKNDNGQTALHLAVIYGNFDAIDYMLSLANNLDKNIIDNEGKTAKDYAMELKNKFPEYDKYVNKL